VVLHPNAVHDHVSVRPPAAPGGSYDFKPGTSEANIQAAVEKHLEHAARPRSELSPRDPKMLVKEVRNQVAGENPEAFEWTWSDADALRVVEEGRKMNLTDTQIRDLIRIAQRKDLTIDSKHVRKQISPDEMIQQMHNHVEVVLPQGHPYRIDSQADFKKFSDKIRSEVAKAGLPTDDIRVQGSALRKPNAGDIDLAVLIDDRLFDAQLFKVFEGKVTCDGKEVHLRVEDLPKLVADIRRDENAGKRYNSTARTLMYAFEHRTIRVQEFPSLNRAKKSLQKSYGDLDITIMSNSGYLNREPFMVLP
jgi:hypothetical protein